MSDTNGGKLTASLEELSLKKQLPLRQQVQKPVLKYDTVVAKPVQLFNHADIVTIHQDSRSALSSLGQASPTNVMVHSQFRSGRTAILASPAPGQVYISPNNAGRRPPSAKAHTNPYARPLSAKDIANDLQSQKLKKSSSSTCHMSSGSSSSLSTQSSSTTNSGVVPFQMNSFMRPQSAVRKDTLSKESSSVTGSRSSSSISSDSGTTDSSKGQDSEPKASRIIPSTRKSVVNTRGGQVQSTPASTETAFKTSQPVSPSKSTVTTLTTQNSVDSTYSKSIASTNNINSRAVPNVVTKKMTADAQSALSNDSNQNDKPGGAETTPIVLTRPTSSIPRPGSACSRSTPSPDSMKQVRNLNYTPTKPYSEVSDPHKTPSSSPSQDETSLNLAQSAVVSKQTSHAVTGKPPLSAVRPVQPPATATSSDVKKPVLNSPGVSNGTGPQDRKLSTTGTKPTAAASTVYYRKGSKSEEVIIEQRPQVVGAPARPLRLLEREKPLMKLSSPEEDEDDDCSEPSVPPGERLPGDGEASLDEFDDDDVLDGLEDEDGSDGESDGYSFTSSLSRRSSSAQVRSGRRTVSSRSSGASGDDGRVRPHTAAAEVIKPALTPSLFANIPPTINFVVDGEKVEQLPWDMRKLMKWRLSPITPNVVKNALARIGFRITKRNHDWLGCWGKHMKSQGFKAIREYQKLNHFPGSFQIGRKDKLWRNLSKMQVHFGKKEFNFFPQTFVLPFDAKLLKRAWEDGGNKQKWIIKPPASARGIGIKVIHKWNQIPRRRPVIVQRYLARPYLINDSKFDMRIYVYVSCYDPLRLYIFEDGLARFASCKYSSAMKNLSNKFMHLTNYSVNKKNNEYQSNGDESVCQGHKWSLKALWNYMKRQGINTNQIWESIKDLIIKTIICADSPINSMIKANTRSRYVVHELFGFDILLDESLKPWILEVNISPSLHSNSQLDVNIKGHMIRDLMNIAGHRLPDKADVSHSNAGTGTQDFSSYIPPNNYCMDKRLYTNQLAPDEKAKHAYYSQRHQDEFAMQTILDTLTPDDMRVLTESIDEDSRKGGFQRVYPTPSTHKYLHYFEQARYYNLLLDQWVQRFNRMEQRGINMLEAYCEDGVVLENPSSNPNHQWNPPNASVQTYREPRMQSAPLTKQRDGAGNLKHSASTSQLPKVTKKPPKPQPARCLSQSSSTSSINSAAVTPSPQPSPKVTSNTSR